MSIQKILQREVKTLPPDATCRSAAIVMRDENIGSVVASEQDLPLGIVTDRDLAIRVIADGGDAEKLLLRDIMSVEPISLGAERSLEQVQSVMRDLSIRRVPIVDDEQRLLGIVSMDDLLLLLSDQLGSLAAAVHNEISQ